MNAQAARAETGRIETFSDGVLAIAITLLGLGLKVPGSDCPSLAASLAAAWPSYVAFVTSFITIAIIWLNHHRLFTHIVRVDHSLLLLNNLLLMTVTLVPFGNAVLAEHIGHPGQRAAAILYNAVFIAVSSAFNLLWRHATRRGRLLDRAVDPRAVRRINWQYGFGPLLYVMSMGLALLSPWASIGADLLFVGFFALPAFTW